MESITVISNNSLDQDSKIVIDDSDDPLIIIKLIKEITYNIDNQTINKDSTTNVNVINTLNTTTTCTTINNNDKDDNNITDIDVNNYKKIFEYITNNNNIEVQVLLNDNHLFDDIFKIISLLYCSYFDNSIIDGNNIIILEIIHNGLSSFIKLININNNSNSSNELLEYFNDSNNIEIVCNVILQLLLFINNNIITMEEKYPELSNNNNSNEILNDDNSNSSNDSNADISSNNSIYRLTLRTLKNILIIIENITINNNISNYLGHRNVVNMVLDIVNIYNNKHIIIIQLLLTIITNLVTNNYNNQRAFVSCNGCELLLQILSNYGVVNITIADNILYCIQHLVADTSITINNTISSGSSNISAAERFDSLEDTAVIILKILRIHVLVNNSLTVAETGLGALLSIIKYNNSKLLAIMNSTNRGDEVVVAIFGVFGSTSSIVCYKGLYILNYMSVYLYKYYYSTIATDKAVDSRNTIIDVNASQKFKLSQLNINSNNRNDQDSGSGAAIKSASGAIVFLNYWQVKKRLRGKKGPGARRVVDKNDSNNSNSMIVSSSAVSLLGSNNNNNNNDRSIDIDLGGSVSVVVYEGDEDKDDGNDNRMYDSVTAAKLKKRQLRSFHKGSAASATSIENTSRASRSQFSSLDYLASCNGSFTVANNNNNAEVGSPGKSSFYSVAAPVDISNDSFYLGLSTTSDGTAIANNNSITAWQWALRLLEAHGRDSVYVLQSGLRLLVILADYTAENWEEIGQGDGCRIIFEAINNNDLLVTGKGRPQSGAREVPLLAVAVSDTTIVETCELAMEVIAALASSCEHHKNVLSTMDSYNRVMEIARAHLAESIHLCELSLHSFILIYYNISAQNANTGSQSLCTTVITIIDKYDNNMNIIENGLWALKLLALYNSNRIIIGNNNGCSVIIRIIRDNNNNLTILRHGCECIANLLLFEGNNIRFVKSGALKLLCSLLVKHTNSNDIDFAEQGIRALQLLAVNNKVLLGEMGACGIVMNIFRHHISIHINSNDNSHIETFISAVCRTVYNLCYNNNSNKKLFLQLRAIADIKMLLDNRWPSHPLREELKDTMKIIQFEQF